MEEDKVADMVADIDLDMVADTNIDIHINMEIQFGERFGHGGRGLPNWAQTCASFKLCEFILLFSFSLSIFHFPLSERRLTKMFHFVFVSLLLFKAALAEDCFDYE